MVEFFDKDYIKSRVTATPGPLDSDCWIWNLAKHKPSGYGSAGTSKRPDLDTYAHRLSYTIFHGPIAPKMYVCHKCDTPPCVNPDHLFQGTSSDNRQDMLAKGRSNHPYGEKSGTAKLTAEDVKTIRVRFENTYYRGLGVDLAEEYGVAAQTIYKIKDGDRWPHLSN